MHRRDIVVFTFIGVQLVLLVATFPMARLGTEPWHHLASLGGILVLAAVLWRPLVRSRRFLAIGVFATSILATVSGFYLLYWKEGIRIDGYQDWGVFWHILWSWAFAVFFLMHTWVNRRAYLHFFRRTLRTLPAAAWHLGGYALVAVGFLATWSPAGRTWFSVNNYIELSLAAWLLATLPPYAVWAMRQRSARTATRSKHAASEGHWTIRRAVDLGLVPIAILAIVSGVILAFFDDIIDPLGFKYVSKYWHVWPSVVFAVLVFIHSVQAWPTVCTHWRRFAGRRQG